MENAVAGIRDILEGHVAETPCRYAGTACISRQDSGARRPSGEDSASLSMTSSDNAIARIRGILEEDDAGTPLCSLQDMLAYCSLTAELAALLQEDSASLSLPRASSSQFEAPVQHLSIAGTSQAVGQLTSGTMSGPDPLIPASCVVLSDRFEGSERLAAIHSNGGFELTNTSMFQRDPRRVSAKHGNKSISKTSLYDEYIGKSIHMPMLPVYISLHDRLLQTAHAVGMNNTGSAMVLARKLKQQTSPHGNSSERLAHYFVKALYARFEGTGWFQFRKQHLSQYRLSPMNILQATLKCTRNSCHFMKACYVFVNQSILRVAKGASTLLILEYQLTGDQYPSLFKELALLPGGPPKVRLIGMFPPHYSMLGAQRDANIAFVEETGCRLSRFADYFKVPFEFVPWVDAWEKLDMRDHATPNRRADEVLVLISTGFMRLVMDDVLDPNHVKKRILTMVYDVNPDLFIHAVVSGAYNTPFFSMRFKEALFHFTGLYDVLDTFTDDWARLVFESEVLGKAILSVVACEGVHALERVEKYKQWQTRIEKTGMQQLPIDIDMLEKVQALLQSYHKDYMAIENRQNVLLGWKGRTLFALSAWKSPFRPVLPDFVHI